MNFKFGVRVDGCNEEFCIFKFEKCDINYCPLPIKLNPFCRAKSGGNCRGLFRVIEKDGKKYILYHCDGRKCPYFIHSMFSNKVLKQFGDNYLTARDIKKMFTEEDLMASKKVRQVRNTVLDFVLKELFNDEVARQLFNEVLGE